MCRTELGRHGVGPLVYKGLGRASEASAGNIASAENITRLFLLRTPRSYCRIATLATQTPCKQVGPLHTARACFA